MTTSDHPLRATGDSQGASTSVGHGAGSTAGIRPAAGSPVPEPHHDAARGLSQPGNQDLVLIGATGDLSRRKILPALYNLYRAGLIPELGHILGFARSRLDTDGFRQLARDSVQEHSRTP